MYMCAFSFVTYPDNKVHGANMGPICDRHDPGGHHVGPMNFALWVMQCTALESLLFMKLNSWKLNKLLFVILCDHVI